MGSLSITLTRTLSSDGPFIGGPLVAAGDKTSIALTDEGLFAHHRVGHSNTGAGNDLRIRVLNANRHHRVGHPRLSTQLRRPSCVLNANRHHRVGHYGVPAFVN